MAVLILLPRSKEKWQKFHGDARLVLCKCNEKGKSFLSKHTSGNGAENRHRCSEDKELKKGLTYQIRPLNQQSVATARRL